MVILCDKYKTKDSFRVNFGYSNLSKENHQIMLRGNYPAGSKLWLYYGDNVMYGRNFSNTAPTKEKAIDNLIKI